MSGNDQKEDTVTQNCYDKKEKKEMQNTSDKGK